MILNMSKIKKSYDDIDVLKNFNLTISENDIVGFIGKNGAGKTTTLKIIVGLLNPDEGEITIDGVLSTEKDYKKKFGYVPDDPFLYEGLTGEEYLMFLSELWNIEFPYTKVKKLLIDFQLERAYKLVISKYSFGMKKKLAIIGALLHESKILILDEPLNGLDPDSAYKTKKILKEYAEQGKAVFFSSHTLEVIEKLCTKIAIIKDGRMIEFKSVNDLVLKDNQSLEDYFREVYTNDK